MGLGRLCAGIHLHWGRQTAVDISLHNIEREHSALVGELVLGSCMLLRLASTQAASCSSSQHAAHGSSCSTSAYILQCQQQATHLRLGTQLALTIGLCCTNPADCLARLQKPSCQMQDSNIRFGAIIQLCGSRMWKAEPRCAQSADSWHLPALLGCCWHVSCRVLAEARHHPHPHRSHLS
jgi:hypothetical protein